jgi:anionic cell wall polymer biosynthesis LytR-Cps2A-Psr (LCP) family protein
MLSPTGIAALPSLIDQLKSNVQTDLSPADISQLVCLAGLLNYEEDISYVTLPEDVLVQQMVYDPARGINTAALVSDKERMIQLLAEFQAGLSQ